MGGDWDISELLEISEEIRWKRGIHINRSLNRYEEESRMAEMVGMIILAETCLLNMKRYY